MTTTSCPSFFSLTLAEQHRTWLAAQHHGGSFLAALAAAWFRADAANRARIATAFPEIVTKFGPGTNFYPTQAEL